MKNIKNIFIRINKVLTQYNSSQKYIISITIIADCMFFGIKAYIILLVTDTSLLIWAISYLCAKYKALICLAF